MTPMPPLSPILPVSNGAVPAERGASGGPAVAGDDFRSRLQGLRAKETSADSPLASDAKAAKDTGDTGDAKDTQNGGDTDKDANRPARAEDQALAQPAPAHWLTPPEATAAAPAAPAFTPATQTTPAGAAPADAQASPGGIGVARGPNGVAGGAAGVPAAASADGQQSAEQAGGRKGPSAALNGATDALATTNAPSGPSTPAAQPGPPGLDTGALAPASAPAPPHPGDLSALDWQAPALPLSTGPSMPPPTAYAAAMADPVYKANLPFHPHDPGFSPGLAAQVSFLLDTGVQQAELRLHPADLGPIHIQMSLTAQTADISFTAASSVTRDSIADALPALRDMLASQGLALGQAGVSSRQEGGQPGWQARGPQPAPLSPGATLAGIPGAEPRPPSAAPRRGVLDIYA